jgi:folate-dependent phosphoribosylglycinamide formyltransferase PurN
MSRPWIAFFSQTGSEIANISQALGRHPDLIVTNKHPDKCLDVDRRIDRLYHLSAKPTIEEYDYVLSAFEKPIVTLHGYLRILPKEICENYEIFNGHPGQIVEYPELKGKDPQVRAYEGIQEGKYKSAGAVLHRVIPEVDEGKIIDKESFNAEGLTLDELFLKLKDRSLFMWINFLRKVL